MSSNSKDDNFDMIQTPDIVEDEMDMDVDEDGALEDVSSVAINGGYNLYISIYL